MSSQSLTKLPDPDEKWAVNKWKASVVVELIAGSTDIITLSPNDTSGCVFKVHKELLCYYSPYYRAAIKGGFKEADQDTFTADVTSNILLRFVKWLYAGTVEMFDDLDRNGDTVQLYMFADQIGTTALKRATISRLCTHDVLGPVNVSKACRNLLKSDTLITFLVDCYVNHWIPHAFVGDEDSLKNSDEQLPYQFLTAIITAKEELVKYGRLEECDCCHNPCKYHHHESEEERLATCGD